MASIEAKLFAVSDNQDGLDPSNGEESIDAEQSKSGGLDNERGKAMLTQCEQLLGRLDR